MTRIIRVANATGMRTTRGANAEFSIGKPGLLVVLFGRHEVIFKALGRRRLKIMETPPSPRCRSSDGHSEVGRPPLGWPLSAENNARNVLERGEQPLLDRSGRRPLGYRARRSRAPGVV